MSKICKQCGTINKDDYLFCIYCGCSLQIQQPNYQQPNYQQYNYQQPSYRQPNYQQPDNYTSPAQSTPTFNMGWFKFIINFQLFAAAVFAIINIIVTFVEITELETYRNFSSAMNQFINKSIGMNIFYIISCLILSAFAIIVRFKLAGYKKNAPTLYILFGVITTVVNTIYLLAMFFFTNTLYSAMNLNMDFSLFSNNFTQILANLVLIIINIFYFKERKSLFVN